jgi:hypothetical protein
LNSALDVLEDWNSVPCVQVVLYATVIIDEISSRPPLPAELKYGSKKVVVTKRAGMCPLLKCRYIITYNIS